VCFSTLPGFYKDTIVVKIGRLSPFYFPVEIELVGNSLVSRSTYLDPCGLQDNKVTPELVMTWNTMPIGNPIVRQTFWIHNSSPFNMVVEWKIMKEVEEKEQKEVDSIKENKGKIGNEQIKEEKLDYNKEIEKEEEVENDEERNEGETKEGNDVEEAFGINEEIIPKIPNLCRVIFDIEENKENSLHCMLVPERNGEDWCVKVCLQEHLGIDYQDLIHVTFQDFLEPFMENELPPFRIVPQK
jgi:hypothetical protein